MLYKCNKINMFSAKNSAVAFNARSPIAQADDAQQTIFFLGPDETNTPSNVKNYKFTLRVFVNELANRASIVVIQSIREKGIL